MKSKVIQFTNGLHFNDWCLIFIILFSLVNLKLVSIGFILWGLGFWFNREKATLNDLFSGINKWFILYYLLLIVGMLWTDNQMFGLSKLENKLSFILFPLLFTFSKLNISKDKILAVFILGLVMSLIVNYSIAIYHTCVFNIPLFDSLFNVNFANFMHHSYYGHYLIIGSLITLDRLTKESSIVLNQFMFLFFSIGVFQSGTHGVLCFKKQNTTNDKKGDSRGHEHIFFPFVKHQKNK